MAGALNGPALVEQNKISSRTITVKDVLRPLLLAFLISSAMVTVTQADTEVGNDDVGTWSPDGEEEGFDTETADPWEGVNRRVFAFNEFADRWVLKPVAKGYHRIAPDPVETGVRNVFSNLGELNTMLNNLLQAKFRLAATDAGRFLINSTLGAVGLIDVASELGLQKNNEDFGQTLGYWGVSSGPYIVVPLLGPRTVRDGLGSVPDAYANPVTYIDHVRTRNSVVATSAVSARASLLDAEKLMQGDRYIFMREAYLQRREFLVRDGAIDDDFGDEEFDDDWEW